MQNKQQHRWDSRVKDHRILYQNQSPKRGNIIASVLKIFVKNSDSKYFVPFIYIRSSNHYDNFKKINIILYMRKLGQREVKRFASGHTVSKWQSQDTRVRLPDS